MRWTVTTKGDEARKDSEQMLSKWRAEIQSLKNAITVAGIAEILQAEIPLALGELIA